MRGSRRHKTAQNDGVMAGRAGGAAELRIGTVPVREVSTLPEEKIGRSMT